MLVIRSADKSSRARDQMPRAGRGKYDRKVTTRIAVKFAGQGRELTVPEALTVAEVLSVARASPSDESRRKVAVRHGGSINTVDDDTSNLIDRGSRTLLRLVLRLRRRLRV